MKINKAIVVIFILILSCSSRKIKPEPKGEDWVICPACKGYGKIKVYDINRKQSFSKKGDYTPKDESEKVCLGCLGGFFRDKEDDYLRSDSYHKDNYEHSSHGWKKETTCGRCKGTGWIKERKNIYP